MLNAIEQAMRCTDDVPIGCVIKKGDKIIASACNRREVDNDVTAHAEMLAIREAQMKLKTSRLTDCDLYVTLEPCPMCSWAILQAKIKTVYFGSFNPEYGVFLSNPNLLPSGLGSLKVYGGIEEELCNKILSDFFTKLRKEAE